VTLPFREALEQITRIRGVRGAMLVAGDDGLVVAEALMEGIRGNAVAALAASLAKRLRKAAEAAGGGVPRFLHLQARGGTLLAVPAPDGILLVAVGDRDVNVGLLRLEMRRVAEAVV
jgi:hypothetical protein